MPENDNNFRASIIGGFNKTDVIDYITRSSSDFKAEIDSLQKDVEALRNIKQELLDRNHELSQTISARDRELEEKSDAFSALQSRADLLERDLSLSRNVVSGKDERISALEGQLSEAQDTIARLNKKGDALNSLIAEQAGKLEDFEQAKLRVADIELAAYDRARQIEDEAVVEAANIRDSISRIFEEIRGKYSIIHNNSNTKLYNVISSLRSIITELEELPAAFSNIQNDINLLKTDDEASPEDTLE